MSAYQVIASHYDLLTGNIDYASYSAYIDNKLTENNISGIILDAGCGTGTMLSLMSRRGYDMIGVDICSEMLAIASNKQTRALLLQQDLCYLDLYGSISGAISTLDVINHFSSEHSLKRFISRVSLFMDDNGIFIFDMNLPFKHEVVLADNTFTFEFDECMLIWQNHLKGRRLHIKLDLFTESKEGFYLRKSESFYEYTYSLEEIKALIEPDFDILEIIDGETFRELSEVSERAVFTTRKRHATL